MPEPKERIQNAHNRALATVAGLEDPPSEETPEPEGANNLSEAAAVYAVEKLPEPKPEPKLAPPPKQRKAAPPAEEAEPSLKREPGEDLIEYINRLPMEVFTAPQAGIFIYKQSQTGNVQLDKIFRPISFDELKNIYAGRYGAGNYYLQFNTRDKRLNAGGQRFTFDGSTLQTLGEGSGGSLGSQALTGAQATSEAIRMVAEASREANKANIELITDITKNTIKPEKGIDVAALITGIATLMPKQDNTMVQFMISEANRRADVAEKEADRREQRAKEEADRRERDAERRASEAKVEADRQRDRDKEFFTLMLKQAEGKADSLNQMTGLLTSFMKAKEMIDDSIGGGPKGPWDLIAGVADSVLQQGPAIVAALKGAPPAQVEQMQRAQNPTGPPAAEQPFYDMVIRLAKYFGRDPQLYDGHYLCQMLEEEYGPVYSDMINQPKETILGAIAAFEPFGKAIMEHPQASVLMGKIIDAIKFPDTMDDIFGGEEEPEKEPVVLHGKARKINGTAKVERAG